MLGGMRSHGGEAPDLCSTRVGVARDAGVAQEQQGQSFGGERRLGEEEVAE